MLPGEFSISEELYQCFDLTELRIVEERIPGLGYVSKHITGFHLWLFLMGAFFVVLNFRNSREIEFKPTVMRSLLTFLFMVWSVMYFAGISTFLYFDF